MKLAIVRRRFGKAGGAERFIVDIMRALEGRGVDARLLSEHVEAPPDLLPRWTRVPETKGGRTARLRGFERNVREAVAAGGFSLVQTHERMTGADIFRAGDGVHAAWVDRLKRERAWWRRPFLDLDPFHRYLIDTEKRMAKESGMLFVANSDLVARELQDWLGLPASRLRTIVNGVDLSRFCPATVEERLEARRAFELAPEDLVVAFAGSGFERKGAFALVEALAQPALDGICAIIAGGDRNPKALAMQVRRLGLDGRVRLAGALPDVRPVLAAGDLFVLPTLYDPMPNAALEALACGLPVVTTADAGVAGMIHDSGAGRVASRRPDELARAIAAVANARGEMSHAALRLRPALDLGHAVRQWLALYDELT